MSTTPPPPHSHPLPPPLSGEISGERDRWGGGGREKDGERGSGEISGERDRWGGGGEGERRTERGGLERFRARETDGGGGGGGGKGGLDRFRVRETEVGGGGGREREAWIDFG